MPVGCTICEARIGEFKCRQCGKLVCKRCCPVMTWSTQEFTCKTCNEANSGVPVGALTQVDDGKTYVWTGGAWLLVLPQPIRRPGQAIQPSRPFGEMPVRMVEV